MHHRTSSPPALGAVTVLPVVRPLSVVLLVLLAGLLLPLLPGLASAAEAAPRRAPVEREPLRLTLDEVSPAVLRGDSDVTLTGTLTNDSDETWTTVNIQSFHSAAPITNAEELAAAADAPVEEYVGERITEAGTFQTVPTLGPGESVDFTVYVPSGSIPRVPGVYWVGVHALGQTETVLRGLHGRARTFLPVVVGRQRRLPASLVLPVRASIRHRADGSVANPAGWTERLGPEGRLHNLLEIGREAGDGPLTWLVDPAVLHVVQRLAIGNPGTTLRPPPADDTDPEPESGDPAPTPSETLVAPTPDPDAGPGRAQDVPTPVEEAAGVAAQAWLTTFAEVIDGQRVLSLPYGDVDVSSLAEAESSLLEAALQRSKDVMTELGIEAQPALASPDGYVSPEALRQTPTDNLVLLSDLALSPDPAANGQTDPDSDTDTDTVITTDTGSGELLGHPFVTISSGVADGGPGPEPAGSRIAVRQRLMSEAALQLLDEDRSPLVVVPPATWDPDASADLTSALDESLVRWRPLTAVVDPDSQTLPDDVLPDESGIEAERLPVANVRTAERLVSSAVLVEGILAEPANVIVQTTDVALTNLSYFTRRDPTRARVRTGRSRSYLDGLLRSVRFDDQLRSVTLSGDSGSFGPTLVNPLDVAVVVGVRASDNDSLTLDDTDPIRLAPRSRRRVLLNAKVTRQGVHRLTLHVTDPEGAVLGSSHSISVRAAQVSGLLWVIMGGGLAMLFGAIGVRLFRRVRAARRAAAHHPADPDPADPDPADPDPADPDTADDAEQGSQHP